ncbi:MAG: hypothetical protein VW580_04310, partial [Flavobacteriaceae bacterium]
LELITEWHKAMTEEYQNALPHQESYENVNTTGICDVAYLRGTDRACERLLPRVESSHHKKHCKWRDDDYC